MQAEIKHITEKKLVGKYLLMSFSHNRTYELWSSFMPQKKAIKNTIGNDLFSLEVFALGFFDEFDYSNLFEKWAAIEVSSYDTIPDNFYPLIIPEGLYAMFNYRGLASDAANFYSAIFTEWLPNSGYKVDYRPHFAIMGEKYKKDSADSEEEIWIPIKK